MNASPTDEVTNIRRWRRLYFAFPAFALLGCALAFVAPDPLPSLVVLSWVLWLAVVRLRYGPARCPRCRDLCFVSTRAVFWKRQRNPFTRQCLNCYHPLPR